MSVRTLVSAVFNCRSAVLIQCYFTCYAHLLCSSVYGSGSIFLCLLVFLMATCNLPTSAAWQMSKFWPRYSIQRHLLPSNKPSKSLLPSEKREQQDNRGKATSRWSTFKQKLRPRPSDFSSRQLDVTKALSYNPSDPLHGKDHCK